MDLMNLLTTAASGPVGMLFGGVVGIGKKWLEGKQERDMLKLKMSERALDRKHDLDLASKEIEGNLAEGKMHLDEKMFEADSKALSAASSRQDAEISGLAGIIKGCYKWIHSLIIVPMFVSITFTQKMIRPVLTIMLVYMTWELYKETYTIIGGLDNLDHKVVEKIYISIIQSILGLTGMAVSFWYVGRPPKTGKL